MIAKHNYKKGALSLFLVSAMILNSCTFVQTTTNSGGKATFASLGGDSKEINISSDGAQIASNTNSEAFTKAARTATAISGIFALASVSKLGISEAGQTDRAGIASSTAKHQSSVNAQTTQVLSNNNTAVKLAKTSASKEVDLSKIAADKEIALKPLEAVEP